MGVSRPTRVLLKKMLFQRRIGGKHIPEKVCLGWMKHVSSKERKLALKEWKKCKSLGLVLTKLTHQGTNVFLNPERLSEIKEMIR